MGDAQVENHHHDNANPKDRYTMSRQNLHNQGDRDNLAVPVNNLIDICGFCYRDTATNIYPSASPFPGIMI